MPRFQPPPRRTQRADFPHCAPPFASCQGLWDLSCWGDFRPIAAHSIGVEQPESVVEPRLTPSFPTEALPLLSMRQLAPDLLLHPILDEAEALAGVHKRQDCSAFALTYILRLRSCKSMDAFIISSLPSLCWRRCKWQGPFAPRTLLRFIATTAATLSSSSRFRRLYLAPAISRWDEEGFSSCSACP